MWGRLRSTVGGDTTTSGGGSDSRHGQQQRRPVSAAVSISGGGVPLSHDDQVLLDAAKILAGGDNPHGALSQRLVVASGTCAEARARWSRPLPEPHAIAASRYHSQVEVAYEEDDELPMHAHDPTAKHTFAGVVSAATGILRLVRGVERAVAEDEARRTALMQQLHRGARPRSATLGKAGKPRLMRDAVRDALGAQKASLGAAMARARHDFRPRRKHRKKR